MYPRLQVARRGNSDDRADERRVEKEIVVKRAVKIGFSCEQEAPHASRVEEVAEVCGASAIWLSPYSGLLAHRVDVVKDQDGDARR